MVETVKSEVPILQIINERTDKTLDVLIEPHLELFEVPPGKSCDVLYVHPSDNTVLERTLVVAQRDDCLVVYPPGEYSPELLVDGVKLENKWG